MEIMQKKNDVYKEVLTILAYFKKDLLEKIPSQFLKELKELASDSKTDFYIDPKKDLDKQDISEESKDFISLIYYSFMAEEEKRYLLKVWNENENKYQEKLRKQYHTDNLFQNRKKEKEKVENTTVSNNKMVVYKKETIWNKIRNFIKDKLKLS